MRNLADLGNLGPALAQSGTVRIHRAGGVDLEICDAVNSAALAELIEWRAELDQPQRQALDNCAAWPYEMVTDGESVIGALVVPVPSQLDNDRRDLTDLGDGVPDAAMTRRIGTMIAWLVGTLDDAGIAHPSLDSSSVLWSPQSDLPFVFGFCGASRIAEGAPPVQNLTTTLSLLGAHLATIGASLDDAVVQLTDGSHPGSAAEWYQAFTSAPPAGPADAAPTAAGPSDGRPRRGRFAVLALIAVALVAAATFFVLSSDDDSPTTAGESERQSEEPESDPEEPELTPSTIAASVTGDDTSATGDEVDNGDGQNGDDEVDVVEPTLTTEPQPTQPSTTNPFSYPRFVTIHAKVVNIRASASLSADIVVTTEEENQSARVLGPIQNGWYEVELLGERGWVFGAFVLPPDPGFIAAVDGQRDRAEIVDSTGTPTGIGAEAGRYVLITDTTNAYWRVLLPSGGTGFIDPSFFTVLG